MNDIRVFTATGDPKHVSEQSLHAQLEAARLHLVAPFAAERVGLVADVGNSILRGGMHAGSPHIMHFAFWIRKTALTRLGECYRLRLPPGAIARPRGLVFHLAPQNVETVFLYSWVLSFLVGNANVVRLPTVISDEMRRICALFLTTLDAKGYVSQLFINCDSDSMVSARISAQSDARVVWGGDAKVAAFAPLPLRNGGKSIWFGNRFSYAVVNGEAISNLSPATRAVLAEKLFNDIFVFDQMACSSPHAIYVVGDCDAHLSSVSALLDTLVEVARRKRAVVEPGHAIRKIVETFLMAASGAAIAINWRDAVLCSVVSGTASRQDRRISGGFLQLAFIPALAALADLVREYDQTITHFGFRRDEIAAAADNMVGIGVSRWAPVGSALDFDFVWDGYDIPAELSRIVRVGGDWVD